MGVVVHLWDYAKRVRAWEPCKSCWSAAFSDRVSASLINARLPFIYTTDLSSTPPGMQGGLVLNPDHVLPMLQCAWRADAGSVTIGCSETEVKRRGCVPGCKGKAADPFCEDLDASVRHYCPWGPSLRALGGMLASQQELLGDGDYLKYNELVFSADTWLSAMPHAIEAVFYLAWDPEESGSHARAVRDAFVTEYGLPRAAVPLLRMHADGPRVRDQPFELADE